MPPIKGTSKRPANSSTRKQPHFRHETVRQYINWSSLSTAGPSFLPHCYFFSSSFAILSPCVRLLLSSTARRGQEKVRKQIFWPKKSALFILIRENFWKRSCTTLRVRTKRWSSASENCLTAAN